MTSCSRNGSSANPECCAGSGGEWPARDCWVSKEYYVIGGGLPESFYEQC